MSEQKQLTWPTAIEKVLKAAGGGALHYDEITDRIIADKLRTSLGKTPKATVSAQLSTSIAKHNEKSPFERVGKGLYRIRGAKGTSSLAQGTTQPVLEEEAADPQYEVVSCFGMFWRRESVAWRSTPRLLGVEKIGASPIDFTAQQGVYLLYDGREIIYVGRSTDRPLGRRLYEHTLDRMAARWNRFSWFGLLPLDSKSQPMSLPPSFDTDKLIPALEAILIESLEPRQNRKRGDDLAQAEFLQKRDPKIAEEEQKRVLERLTKQTFGGGG